MRVQLASNAAKRAKLMATASPNEKKNSWQRNPPKRSERRRRAGGGSGMVHLEEEMEVVGDLRGREGDPERGLEVPDRGGGGERYGGGPPVEEIGRAHV